MSEIDSIKKLLEEGFQPHMILRKPTEDEVRRRGLPACFGDSETRALPLRHPDGRKCMFYIRDPEAIAFAEKLVEEKKRIIGYDLCVYCSGIGHDTIHGRKLSLDKVIENLSALLGWNLSISDYPHTFEVSFKIETDDKAVFNKSLDDVKKVALALSLRNKLGFVVEHVSPGTRYKGQPFSGKWGLQERFVAGLTQAHLDYIEKIILKPEAMKAAKALQLLYSQVSDDSKITFAWAAIEDIFGNKKINHLLNKEELDLLLDTIRNLVGIHEKKREKLIKLIEKKDLMADKSRNERISEGISELTGECCEEVLCNIKTLASERGRRVHLLSNEGKPIKDIMEFIENVLWAVVEKCIQGSNPFKVKKAD